jgi:hypothetical protein
MRRHLDIIGSTVAVTMFLAAVGAGSSLWARSMAGG